MTGSLQPMLAQLAAPTVGGDALLPLLVLVPLIAAAVVALMRDSALSRTIAVGAGIGVFAVALIVLGKLGVRAPTGEAIVWNAPPLFRLGQSGFSFSFLADGPAAWLVLLTSVLVPCAMLATARGIARPHVYYAWLLVLEATLFGAFLASDVILFYVFFELTLVPSFFLIAGWGGEERRYAATKFFVYTFAGSLFMLASILYLVTAAKSADIATCVRVAQSLTHREQFWVMLGFLAGLGVKVPLLPLHTWLPNAYTAAPGAVTALLTGALAKLGTYGLLRIAVPAGLIRADGTAQSTLACWLVAIAILGIIYAALVAWTKRDAKTLLAYSSISHLGFCVLALVGLTTVGGQAGLLYMVNHGISAAGLFFLIGMIEQRFGTRSLDHLSGLGRERPILATLFVLFVMSSIGLPATGGFVSEFLSILSTRAAGLSMWATVLAASGIVLGAVYMLFLTGKLIFGPAKQPEAVTHTPGDLNWRELGATLPLAAAVLILGFQPNLVLESIKPSIARTMTRVQANPLEHVVDAAAAPADAVAKADAK